MYFKNLPDILYLKYKKNPFDGNYILIKNIFARIKLIDDIVPSATIFDDYFIQDGERPDTIANDFYESPYKDWVIILINNINNVYSDWPLTRSAFDDYVRSKYPNPESPHHYETIEQYYNGNLLLPAGLQVGESFQYKKPNGVYATKEESRGFVTNYEYENRLNEKKREILILKPQFVDPFESIVQNYLKFTPSTEYVNESLKISKN
jgi:hypothetical protein